MRNKWISIFWGIVLVLAGVLFLAYNFNWIPEFDLPVLTWVFAGISLLFFTSYFVSGWQNWGWLFPAFIFAGLALTTFLIDQNVDGAILGAPIFVAVAIPFLVGFARNPRENWGLLIPAWVMIVLTAITALNDLINNGEVIGSIVLFSVGLPFLLVYLLNRNNWWALIPGLILVALGLIVLLTTFTEGEIIAAVVLLGIAFPFLLIYLTRRENWWALIPAGILTSIALVTLLSLIDGVSEGLKNGLLMLGFAATFFLLWLLRGQHPTSWGIYPAVVLACVGAISLLFSSWFTWPILLVVGGGLLLYRAFKPR
jgi:hypothetical protein